MKKLLSTTLCLALLMTLSSLALAQHMKMDMKKGMGHGAKAGMAAMSPEASLKMMQDNLNMLKEDTKKLKQEKNRQAVIKDFDQHMTDMHHGMMGVENHAKKQNDASTKKKMKQVKKDMMISMKGRALLKKTPDAGIVMIQDGLDKMEKTIKSIKLKSKK